MRNQISSNPLLLKVKSHLSDTGMGENNDKLSYVSIFEGEFLIFLSIWKQVCQKNCQLGHSSYLSAAPPTAWVYFFQAGVLFPQGTRKGLF